MSKFPLVNALVPARQGGARFLLASLAVLLGGSYLRAADNIVPQAVCAEYYTAPVTGAIGAARGTGSGGAFGTTNGKGYIAHFAYISTEANTITIPYGLLFGNYLSPGAQVAGNQPTVFSPGYSQTFSLPLQYSAITWYLGGNAATITPIGANDGSGSPLPPSPTCAPAFIPSTSLSFSQPGTFTHQYLGQIDSGPRAAADLQFAVTALSGDPNITYANLVYLPNDTANPAGSLNPNSIYGDITVADGASNVSAVRLQLSANGKMVVKGLTSIRTSIQLPDLTVSAAHSPATFTTNDASDQITITAANIGTSSSGGSTVTVTDTLPAGIGFVSSPTPGWTCASGNPTAQTVQCTTSQTLAATNGTLAVVLNVSVAGSTNTPLTNSVTVACACAEGSTTNNANTDSIPVLQTTNVTLDTLPTGLQISGDGGATFYTAPHTFQWLPASQHAIDMQSPQSGGVGTQYVFGSWSDSGAVSHTIAVPAASTTYTASFTTQYLLTTGVNVAAGGSITPGSAWVTAGAQVNLSATPGSPAYVFVNFTGAVSSSTNPNIVTVNAPAAVTANFNGGPASLGGSLGIKSGPMNARVWPFTIGNNGPGEALGAQVSNLVLVQTAGAACTPAIGALPVIAGDLAPHATGTASVTIDFSSCQASAMFKATFNLSANSGAANGTVVKTSQLP
jgi:uncharacterized repeat protein (TIGR01451 family)